MASEHRLTTHDGLELVTWSRKPENPRATVILVHGAADHSARHADTVDRLVANGFAVYAFDQRGHGRSGGARGHVESFADYVDDLRRVVDWVRPQLPAEQPVFLLGHSNGGLVTALYVLDHAAGIAGTIYSAPHFGLANAPWWKRLLAATVGRVAPRLAVAHGIGPERLTSDPERQQTTANDTLFVRVVTPRWYHAAKRAIAELHARAHELRLPTLLLVPEDDSIVNPPATRRVFEAMGASDKQWTPFAGGRHEMFNEAPPLRDAYLSAIIGWLEHRTSAREGARPAAADRNA